jgi:hypothetical protein
MLEGWLWKQGLMSVQLGIKAVHGDLDADPSLARQNPASLLERGVDQFFSSLGFGWIGHCSLPC